MTRRGRGNKTPNSEREQRVGKEIELVNAGASSQQIQQELGISRTTLWRDLHEHAVMMAEGNKEAYRKLRGMQVGSLLDMAEDIATGRVEPEVANSWRQVMADVSRLLGLNSPSKSMQMVLHASVNMDRVDDPNVKLADLSFDELCVRMARDILRDLDPESTGLLCEYGRSLRKPLQEQVLSEIAKNEAEFYDKYVQKPESGKKDGDNE